MKQYNKLNDHNLNTLQPGLCGDDPSPRLGFLRGVFLANHLASTDNLTEQRKDRKHTNKN